MLLDDLPLEDITSESVDQTAKSGGLIPEGKYHVRLDGAGDVVSKNHNAGCELTFVILTGPFAGQEVKETIWSSDNDKAKNRLVLFAHRLGLLKHNDKTKRYERVEGKDGFGDVLGAECVIEVAHREYEKKDKTKGKAANVTFGGIWEVDDKDVKNVPKAKPTSPGTNGASAKPTPTRKPAVDTSGI
jgi:hypothetical protein